MAPELDNQYLLSSLRAERRTLFQDPALYSPNKHVERALEHLTQEIREGNRDDFKALLQSCLETDTPKGAAAALIDRLMPPQPSRSRMKNYRGGAALSESANNSHQYRAIRLADLPYLTISSRPARIHKLSMS